MKTYYATVGIGDGKIKHDPTGRPRLSIEKPYHDFSTPVHVVPAIEWEAYQKLKQIAKEVSEAVKSEVYFADSPDTCLAIEKLDVALRDVEATQ